MKLPDERTMSELLSMGKDLEDRPRRVYEMRIAFAQKYEQRLGNQQAEPGSTTLSRQKTPNE